MISHCYYFRFVTACLAFQSHQIQKALVSRLKTLQSAPKKKEAFSLITQSKLKFLFLKLGPCAARRVTTAFGLSRSFKFKSKREGTEPGPAQRI